MKRHKRRIREMGDKRDRRIVREGSEGGKR